METTFNRRVKPLLRAIAALVLAINLNGAANAEPVKADQAMDIAQLRQAGWKAPYPPYPVEAYRRGEAGDVFLHLKTDATGKVTEARVMDQPESTKSESLLRGAASYLRVGWQGPPNSQAVVKVSYRLR